jgi:hypothetical protein
MFHEFWDPGGGEYSGVWYHVVWQIGANVLGEPIYQTALHPIPEDQTRKWMGMLL